MSDATETKARDITIEDIAPKLEQLEQMLLDENPDMPVFLREINEDLRQYPELTYLLNDDQIKAIVTAIRHQTNIAIRVKSAKKKGKQNVLDDGRNVADLL